MKRILPILLALFLGVAHAAERTVGWTNATTNTDGSSIPTSGPGSLTHTRVEYGTCGPNNTFGTRQGQIDVPAPGRSVQVNLVVVQMYCIRAIHVNTYGAESAPSSVVVTEVAPPVPNPPSDLQVANRTVYTVIKQVDRFVLLPVGTVPDGTQCIRSQSVNGYYAVPRASVIWSGNVQPDVVVAQCS
jgi:hypothetical protein